MLDIKLLQPEVSEASEVLHLKLWEGTAFDYSLNGNSGTVSGTTTFYTYPGLDLAGADELITVSDDIAFSPVLSPLTISAWVNMDDATNFIIVGKYDTAGTAREWLFYSEANDKLLIQIWDETTDKQTTRLFNTAITSLQNIWIHVAATYDGTTSLTGVKIYLNGTQVDDTDSSDGPITSCRNTATDVTIGHADGVYANGQIDDVRIYTTERTAAQVKDFYEQTRWRYGV